jgi:hypothetical protein
MGVDISVDDAPDKAFDILNDKLRKAARKT